MELHERKMKPPIQNVENIMHGTAFKMLVKHIEDKRKCLLRLYGKICQKF